MYKPKSIPVHKRPKPSGFRSRHIVARGKALGVDVATDYCLYKTWYRTVITLTYDGKVLGKNLRLEEAWDILDKVHRKQLAREAARDTSAKAGDLPISGVEGGVEGDINALAQHLACIAKKVENLVALSARHNQLLASQIEGIQGLQAHIKSLGDLMMRSYGVQAEMLQLWQGPVQEKKGGGGVSQ